MKKVIFLIMLLACMLSVASPVLACDPPPDQSYMDCNDLGSNYAFGFRINGANDGVYPFIPEKGKLLGGAPKDPNNSVTIAGSDGRVFDWSATLGIDAVIVIGGGTSKVYKHAEKKEGVDYHGTKESSSKYYPVEKVVFCYDYELSVTPEAQGNGSSSVAWTIDKTVDVTAQSRFIGESADFNYTVAVTKIAGEGGGGASQIASSVKIRNNTPLKTKIMAVGGSILPLKRWIKFTCANVKFPYYLYPGKELVCTGVTPVSAQFEGTISANVRTMGSVKGAKSAAPITWSGTGGGVSGVGTVTVTDTNTAFGGPHSTSASQTWNYPVSLTCPTDPAAYTNGVAVVALENTAALTETNQQASQSVTLNCYAPVTSSTGGTVLERQYFWGITKTSPITQLVMDQDQVATVPYAVGVDVERTEERGAQVRGTVTIANPNPAAPMTVTVTDEVQPGVPAQLTGCTNPVTVPAGGSVTCDYEFTPAENVPGTNVAQVVFNGFTFTTTAVYDFTTGEVLAIDRCVTVYDDAFPNSLGVVCAEQVPGEFTYDLAVGPYTDSACNERTSFLNTAYFITNDTQSDGWANWEVLITIRCDAGTNCTYTPYYWATHSDPDSPFYKPTWDQVGGPSAPFFSSGYTWLGILEADSTASTYLKLAREYIAAELNVLYGATASDTFRATVAHAATLADTYATQQSLITGDVLADFTHTTDLLDMFNKGLTGPGLCPECEP